jgi:hypothetical protein
MISYTKITELLISIFREGRSLYGNYIMFKSYFWRLKLLKWRRNIWFSLSYSIICTAYIYTNISDTATGWCVFFWNHNVGNTHRPGTICWHAPWRSYRCVMKLTWTVSYALTSPGVPNTDWKFAGGILSNTLRPPVPASCDPQWRELMEQCWSNEPDKRPSFKEVVSHLRSMLEANQSRPLI